MMRRRHALAWLAALPLAGLVGLAHAGAYEDFFRALGLDDAPAVAALLQRGFDPNARDVQGQSALMRALHGQHYRVAAVLAGAKGLKVEERNARDESALMLAALRGQVEIARTLIARDADVNKTGWTPLHYAASSIEPGAQATVALLLEESAYIDAASPNGTTPLMMAVRYGLAEVARQLLREGADPSIKNDLGLAAIDFARQAGRADMVALIEQALVSRRPNPGKW